MLILVSCHLLILVPSILLLVTLASFKPHGLVYPSLMIDFLCLFTRRTDSYFMGFSEFCQTRHVTTTTLWFITSLVGWWWCPLRLSLSSPIYVLSDSWFSMLDGRLVASRLHAISLGGSMFCREIWLSDVAPSPRFGRNLWACCLDSPPCWRTVDVGWGDREVLKFCTPGGWESGTGGIPHKGSREGLEVRECWVAVKEVIIDAGLIVIVVVSWKEDFEKV